MVPFERAFVTSYMLSIATFPLSLRVSEILPLSCSSTSTPLFLTPPLVSPKFPNVPLGIGGWPLGYEKRGCWANWPWNNFPRFLTYILIHQTDERTGRQTDGRTTCNRNTALCTIVHRAVKISKWSTFNHFTEFIFAVLSLETCCLVVQFSSFRSRVYVVKL